MKHFRKIAGEARLKNEKALLLIGRASPMKESERTMEEIHKRATEIGAVLEDILHIHCEDDRPWWN